eukprot:TRINITY_DN9501_c0_g1_i1.p1 TRINITY_DN9501_c0_g1~~TRINITY_DN9501_c0_g1_i1.p1  ORF type:complete len:283 (-),score=52.96 TRINITY_DN9501_c0_g1_i1:106-876(-)
MIFLFVVVFLSFLPTITVIIWLLFGLGNYSGFAFSWSNDTIDGEDPGYQQWQTLNWHPLLMTISFGTLFSQAIVYYRLLPFSHNINKYIHATVQGLALLFSSIAIFVVFMFKKKSENDNMYTGHSYIGMASYVLFLLQFVIGFIAFLFPKLPDVPRKIIHSIHIPLGLLIYISTFISIGSGVVDRELIGGGGGGGSYGIDGWPDLYTYSWIGGNLVTLSLLLPATVVLYVVMNIKSDHHNHNEEKDKFNIQNKIYT